jgi:hypothetical protein
LVYRYSTNILEELAASVLRVVQEKALWKNEYFVQENNLIGGKGYWTYGNNGAVQWVGM